MKNRFRSRLTFRSAAIHLALLAAMIFLNYCLPQRELLAYPLLFAAILGGLNPFACGGAYLIASFPALSPEASLCAAVQAAFTVLAFCIVRRLGRRPGAEKYAFALAAQLPFVFLFPHAGYPVFGAMPLLAQKAVLSAFGFLLCILFEGALRALLFRAFRARLPAHALAQILLLWLLTGSGLYAACGPDAFFAVTCFFLFSGVLLLKNAAAVPFALALSLPLLFAEQTALPCGMYAIYACAALLFLGYGRAAAALALFACYLVAGYFFGKFALPPLQTALFLLACALPLLILLCVPSRALKKLRAALLFYRERALPRIAVNRSRRAVGEQLYEVSALFREIAAAFSVGSGDDGAVPYLKTQLTDALCKDCANLQKCTDAGVFRSMDRLIEVGCSKGRVNLIDLPSDLTGLCLNSAGLLFTLNKHLAEYIRFKTEMDTARAGRELLAEQARGVSEILKDLALTQSEEYVFSEEEETLAKALAGAGILSYELFLYGDEEDFTATMTLPEDADAKKVCALAGKALGRALTLADKIPLGAGRACFVLRKKAKYDAAFGIAAQPKTDTAASGDTHSVLKLTERSFMVALSDGMGSGEGARDVSDRTLSLLESFYKAKMPSDVVLTTVNRLLSFSSEETFACLDLAVVDLETGIADLVKIGAPAGFILSKEKLRVLEGDSLPMGMLETVHPATMRTQLGEGDFLLFLSDGVTGAFPSSTELYTYLSGLRPLNPQALSEDVLQEALRRYGGKAEDDMTVLAVRLLAA